MYLSDAVAASGKQPVSERAVVLPVLVLAMLADFAVERPAPAAAWDDRRAAMAVKIVERLTEIALAPEIAVGGLAPWQLNRVRSHIERELDNDLSLTSLAAIVGLSPKHFARAFRQSTGMPPHRYVVGRRLMRACTLLRDPAQPCLVDIALNCGFADQSHFNATFRRATGLSPGQYRRQRQLDAMDA